MLENFDELELLSLIEGELDPKAAAVLRAKLAGAPKDQALVEQMSADRRILRSIPEPELPRDFLVDVEPMLARPMLVGDWAGDLQEAEMIDAATLRRQHRRRGHSRVWRITAAAVVGVCVIGASWGLFNALRGHGGSANDRLARSEPGDRLPSGSGVSADSATGSAPESLATAPSTVHNYPPLPTGAGISSALAEAGREPASGEAPLTVAAEFALVLRTSSQDAAEASMVQLVESDPSRTALVRNFSYAEAQRLEAQWRVSSAANQAGAPTALATATSFEELALRAEQQLIRERAVVEPGRTGLGSAEDSSGRLAGAEALAPTFAYQVEFASRGAQYTIAVPASELSRLLETLTVGSTGPERSTVLRLLPAAPLLTSQSTPRAALRAEPNVSQSAAAQWLAEGPPIRRAIQRLEASGEQTLVLLPIIVETSGR